MKNDKTSLAHIILQGKINLIRKLEKALLEKFRLPASWKKDAQEESNAIK